jgi:hypothetical protein
MKSRRRSLSATRTLDSTANFVGRIGASLRISARKKSKVIHIFYLNIVMCLFYAGFLKNNYKVKEAINSKNLSHRQKSTQRKDNR